ncbi:DUF1934 domain-containing protein [Bacillus shivajii]|uniref:DUF1934 domain-containing protein n=1 Tax=Bacillus shivajii TaxID=1983719 RepID=UPI001CFB4837|nr:DUF1934 domain-containing protein [Bacillus shivajii]UCZ53064.1 DUF1934 domain-containing protein [Bacillus shivajii]
MSSIGRPVTITMNTTIRDGKEKETNEFCVDGQIIEKGSSVYLKFIEPKQDEDYEATTQTVKIQDNEMRVIRKGAFSMNQRFIAGTTTEGVYNSPLGAMSMLTKTDEVSFHWDEKEAEGAIRLTYTLEIQGENTGEYDLRVNIKEAVERQ